jgi:copper transport protein
MKMLFRAGIMRRLFLMALPFALGLVLLVPPVASAHTVLSRPQLANDAASIDGPAFFNLIMVTLVEVGAIFWVGAQLWLVFVLQPAQNNSKDTNKNGQAVNAAVQQRFERIWAVPTLLLLLLANIGIIVGQILSTSGGQWASALSPQILWHVATTGQFGTYWTLRETSIAVALLLALYALFVKERPRAINGLLPSLNLLLGAMLFIAISMSGHASAVSSNLVIYAVLVDWFHLAGAALWVGSMFYIVTSYLPVLQQRSLGERAQSLITALPYYAPLAIAGIFISAVTGFFSANVHLSFSQQLFDTAYGRTLIVKSVLVGVLVITSLSQILLLRPRVAKEYKKYIYAKEGVQFNQTGQVKMREERLTQRTRHLTTVLRWEPLLGVAVLLCVGLMNVFAGTLSASASQPSTTSKGPSSYNTTVQTTDGKFTAKLNVNPNRFGTNVFTVTVIDNSTGKVTTNVSVSLFTSMLDMDMGTDTIALKANSKGNFSGSGDFSMGGNWEIRIVIHTPDAAIHEATVKLFTPF